MYRTLLSSLTFSVLAFCFLISSSFAQIAPPNPVAPSAPEPSHRRPSYMMLSAYGLYPDLNPSSSVTSAMRDLATHHAAGIVYGTLGIAPNIQRNYGIPADFDPNAYNVALFSMAHGIGTDIWLQLRYYDNNVLYNGARTNITAPEILDDKEKRRAFLSALLAAVSTYHEAYPDNCTIILGEEETVYHSENGGGKFWVGENVWENSSLTSNGEELQENDGINEIFIRNFHKLNKLMIEEIKNRYSTCKVGIHIGHAPLYQSYQGQPVYKKILEEMPPLDFTFYDLYEKVSSDDADFYDKLSTRIRLLKNLGQTVYYLAEHHTPNNFRHGLGRTPSRQEITDTASLARSLNVEGFGYYIKNAAPTMCSKDAIEAGYWESPHTHKRYDLQNCNASEDHDPLDPNKTIGFVYETSPKRWLFGLEMLDRFRSGP